MRAWLLLGILLAGCSQPAPPPGPEGPIYGAEGESLYHFGPHTAGTPDAYVVAGRCGDKQNVMAYTIDVQALGFEGEWLTMRAQRVPSSTTYAVLAFAPGPGGLVLDSWRRGGTDVEIADGHTGGFLRWFTDMPTSLWLTVPEDGLVRLVLACRGEGTINYVLNASVGDPPPAAPHYLEAQVATGFEAVFAWGSEPGIGLVIQPPGVTGLTGALWSHAGPVEVRFDEQVPAGVRRGQTAITWAVERPGWSESSCSHGGWSDYGSWSYDGQTHAAPVQDAGTLLAGYFVAMTPVVLRQAGQGESPASLQFALQHDVSNARFWDTKCDGFHLSAPLETLLDAPGATLWEPPVPSLISQPVPP